MKSSFTSRRKGRIVGQEEESSTDASGQFESSDDKSPSPLPTATARPVAPGGSSKGRKKSSLRLSFGPGETSASDLTESPEQAFVVKKSNLSRRAIEKNAARKAGVLKVSSDQLPIRPTASERPSYSREYLDELKNSTPSTPQDLKSLTIDDADDDIEQEDDDEDDDVDNDALGKSMALGASFGLSQAPHVPSGAEIREKKERRARIAQEQDFINLDEADESDKGKELSTSLRPKWEETRLVRDDEDFGEGFDEFVDDGGITLGKKADKEQRRKRRAEMQALIKEAEGSSEETSDDSDADRRAAYEAAQTRAGAYGSREDAATAKIAGVAAQRSRAQTPPKMTPIPSLEDVLARLEATLGSLEYSKMQNIRKMEELAREKAEIAAREIEIQTLLKDAGENYERLRADASVGDGRDQPGFDGQLSSDGGLGKSLVSRGLESMGNTPEQA
ncbi:MAG: hypothetical protein M1825_000669 [Sarcosagium campestre]|nr:MAG: hypothetical protein M1825_000669 [Sarcosagium campestre]